MAGSFGLVTAAAIALAVSTVLIKQEQTLTDKARQQADLNAASADENAHLADANAKQADKKAREAQSERARAEQNARNAHRQLAMSYIERGINELEHGDPARGLAVLGQAYRAANEANDIGLRHGVCLLLGAWQSTSKRRIFHEGWVDAVAFSPDGTRIATVTVDNVYHFRPMGIPGWQVHEEVLVRANMVRGSMVRLWDAATGQPLGQLLRHDAYVWAVAFSPDGKKVATGSDMARLWDIATGQPLGSPMKHKSFVLAVAFSPDGKKVATAMPIRRPDYGMAARANRWANPWRTGDL